MSRPEMRKILCEGAAQLGVELDDKMLDSFELYKELLLEWNERMNLTSITDEEEIVIKHFIDSLSIIPHIPNKNLSLVDIGTGAGFPGLAIKIAKGCGRLLLLDSLEKRIKFLEHAVSALGLNSHESLNILDSLNTPEPAPHTLGPTPTIHLLHSRAEDAGHDPEFREIFDCATARAVSALNVLLEYCLPFVKVGGVFISMKGNNAKQECDEAKKALAVLGAEIMSINEFTLPFSELRRSLIIIKKFRHIPTMYPRKAGKPSKFPLK